MELEEKYRSFWRSKTIKQIEAEIRSFRAYFQKHKDCFFHKSSPTSLSDGQQFNILRDVLEEKKNEANANS
jgi:hypothetical protein